VPAFRLGDHVRIKLSDDCRGSDRPHDPSEQGATGLITAINGERGHVLFVRFIGSDVSCHERGIAHSIHGLAYRPDELELLDDGDDAA